MVEKLHKEAREAAVKALDAWRYDAGKAALVRDFSFADFSQAFGFMARVALAAEKADHHPDWSNSYNTVSIALSTHDAGGVSQKDIDLARAIDALV